MHPGIRSLCIGTIPRSCGVCVGACYYPDTPNSVCLHIGICVYRFHHSGSFARARQCHHGDANFHALSPESPLGPRCPNPIVVCSKHAQGCYGLTRLFSTVSPITEHSRLLLSFPAWTWVGFDGLSRLSSGSDVLYIATRVAQLCRPRSLFFPAALTSA